MSDDEVLQVGDWHHLKITVKLAAGTSTSDDHSIFYRVVVNKDTWSLSVNSSGKSSVIAHCLCTIMFYIVQFLAKNVPQNLVSGKASGAQFSKVPKYFRKFLLSISSIILKYISSEFFLKNFEKFLS